MDAKVRNRIIEIFEKHRAVPGAAYEEKHFLDFLLAAPGKKDAVYNRLGGTRRLMAFVNEVQYDFAVCFSMADYEANYPLDQFTDRVLELQKSPRGSLQSLNNQVKAGGGWPVLVVADFLLLLAAVRARNSTSLLAVVGGVAVISNAWFVWFVWKARTYLARLRVRIMTVDRAAVGSTAQA